MFGGGVYEGRWRGHVGRMSEGQHERQSDGRWGRTGVVWAAQGLRRVDVKVL